MLPQDTFSKYVRDVLVHLYDPVYLQKHPLGQALVSLNAANHGIRAQMLREIVVEAIEQLQPDRRLPFGSKEWISYRILNDRYLEAMTPKEVADKLHISERHFFRQHRQAVEAVTAVLWDRYIQLNEKSVASGGETAGIETLGISDESELADSAARQMVEHSRRQRVYLSEIANGLQHVLQPLADRKGVKLDWDISLEPSSLWIDPAVLRQIVLNVAVTMLEQSESGIMCMGMHREGSQVLIGIECSDHLDLDRLAPSSGSLAVVHHLVRQEGGDILFSQPGTHECRVLISLPVKMATILMIDDNPDTIALFQRYLQGTDYRLVGAVSGEEGLELAETLKPDTIILDVMMPSQDGWQVLQSLRARAATSEASIVVCSVLAQAELALTMGADDLIQKPVSQQALLDVLERWCHDLDNQVASS
jgi:CheY-like chemotaxis protein